MKSARLIEFGSPLELEEKRDPSPKGTEILLEVLACGVCHSDLHLRDGYYQMGKGEKLWVKDRGVRLPLTPGHEVVGRVLQVGPEAGKVPLGAVKLVYPWIGCGECEECEEGTPQLCSSPKSLGIYQDGGYSDRILVPHPKWLLDTHDLLPEYACSYACAGLTAYGALKKSLPLSAKDHLLIIGAGGLGMFAAQLLPLLTDAKVIFLDLDEGRLAKIREFGFQTVNSSEGETSEAVRKIVGPKGVSAAIDFVNNSVTSSLAFSLLKKNGKMISVGLFGGELKIPTPILSLRSLTVRGSYTGSPSELAELLQLVSEKKLAPIPVQVKSLKEADSILNDLASGKVLGRVVLTGK
ncbi:alcohol dehydrogenase [Leptospira langatensis]|uniref:Alcohol dehydrogenase n=1 Tax=Leptospira langatensis TaxID=2484983 RepID=A0A5F1ZNH8_9LEPT|nr:alcohol dehydrogenase [Leptospira langatensis]TGK05252.1 alcohol dehydrogenase [Leptospira langatensis]TGL38388.1 alcohol dehydrogenase [Leptospira langatensis]